jgi:hypothetical protein
MNDLASTPDRELIFRRLADPFPLGPGQYGPTLWITSVVIVLLLAAVYIGWLYARDSRTVRWYGAVPLAVLRFLVYVLLAVAFLLPAVQQWETTEKRSRVVLVLDVSPSVAAVADDPPSDSARKPKTRLDQVLDTLADDKLGLVRKLLERNPVVVYRFGSRLDDDGLTLEPGSQPWTRDEWAAWARYDFRPVALAGVSPDGQKRVRETPAWTKGEPGTADWAAGWSRAPEGEVVPAGLTDADKAALVANRARVEKRVDVVRAVAQGTNVAESLTAVVNREAGNMVQGLVVVSDGRSTLGSESALRPVRDRLTREKIPVFTIAVGAAREPVGIAITDVQAPDRAAPDEQFKVAVEADGVGLADTEVEVKLGLYAPGNDPKAGKPDHELTRTLKFAGDTTPPHGSAEFVIDPEAKDFPAGLTEPSKKPGRQRQLKQGPWAVVATIPRDKREVFAEPAHNSAPRTVQVIDKPVRVLLFAGAATREYQTLRTLLVRESQQNRAELSIYLQTEAAREGTAVQDVPPERLLGRFPTTLDTTGKPPEKPEDKFLNLDRYDLVIAFDPDWSELSADQVKNLQTWVDELGGGLIYVAGPVNTFQLARADEGGRLKPLLDVLPVVPDDVILVKARANPRTPRRLALKPNPDFDVLRLDDDKPDDPAAGWERYFTGRDDAKIDPDARHQLSPERGFYAYYPVKGTKPGASTLAEFLDIRDETEAVVRGDPKPWLVTAQPARGRSVFLAAGEVWRLRGYDPDYYDRFWVKLTRYAAGNRDAKAARGRVLVGKEFTAGSAVRVQVKLLGPNGLPYPAGAVAPRFTVGRYTADGEKVKDVKDEGPFDLKPRRGGDEFDGYYAGQLVADPARFPAGPEFKYRVSVDVPDSLGETLTADFGLKRSDPELDNTRPDFAALELAAGTLDEVRMRIKDPAVYAALRGAETDPAKVKLAFRLGESDKLGLIPEAVGESPPQILRNRGPVRDLWDRGPVFAVGERQVEVSWLLLAAVGLLSVEWLVRKLMRLA